MIDYLLKFSSKEVFVEFCISIGLAIKNSQDEWIVLASTHDYCLLEIGEHQRPTGKMIVDQDGTEYAEKLGDGNYWVLYRDFAGTQTLGNNEFIFWSSNSGIERPVDESIAPTIFWA